MIVENVEWSYLNAISCRSGCRIGYREVPPDFFMYLRNLFAKTCHSLCRAQTTTGIVSRLRNIILRNVSAKRSFDCNGALKKDFGSEKGKMGVIKMILHCIKDDIDYLVYY